MSTRVMIFVIFYINLKYKVMDFVFFIFFLFNFFN